jgi:hypothetical protein
MFDHKDIVIMSYDDNLQLMEHPVFVCQLRFSCKKKCTLVQALRLCTSHTAHRGSRGIALYPFLTTALKGGEGSASRLGRLLPQGNTRYLLYMMLDGPQGRSGQVRKISPPPGFDPRTVQLVASRYTDRAIPAHISCA